MRVVPVSQLFDNYAYLVIDEDSGVAGVVDVAEADGVLEAVRREAVELVSILSTHHHPDHVGGNADLLSQLGSSALRVYGYAGDADRIPGMTDPLDDGEGFELGGLKGKAIFIPAHTRGHIAYHFPDQRCVFTGDTLFAGGCGRLFEGDAAQMRASLERLAGLPDDTSVYCGHEYTQSNLAFAATLEPNNPALRDRIERVAELRSRGRPTVPSTIGEEKATNPFLRCGSEELRASLRERVEDVGDDIDAFFAAARRLKDAF
ncbi:MAG: hydroxyacylglutathione hydrolase [Candidatus Binatia bacterium]